MPGHPFHLVGFVELTRMHGISAASVNELRTRLETVPADIVEYHTFGVVRRATHTRPHIPNDFAQWVAASVGDRELAERLAFINGFYYPTVETVREALVDVLAAADDQPASSPFYLSSSERFDFEVGVVEDDAELAAIWPYLDTSVIYLSLVEAEHPIGDPDRSVLRWLAGARRQPRLAGELRSKLNPFTGGLERLRAELADVCWPGRSES